MAKTSQISIPEELYLELKERSSNSNFNSVDEYAEFILKEVIHEFEESNNAPDEDEVKERLKSLGYVE